MLLSLCALAHIYSTDDDDDDDVNDDARVLEDTILRSFGAPVSCVAFKEDEDED